MFALLNPDKESIALDLSREAGRSIALRLVDWADVVAENFSPGVMARWELDAATLRRRRAGSHHRVGLSVRPDRTPAALPGLRRAGRGDRGLQPPDGAGPTARPWVRTRRSPTRCRRATWRCWWRRPSSSGAAPGQAARSTSPRSRRASTACRRWSCATARGRRRPSGAATTASTPPRTRSIRARATIAGSRSPSSTSRPSAALARLIGASDWADDERFRAASGRLAHQDEIDERIAAFTRERDGASLVLALREAGVECGARCRTSTTS